jgi:hypothetical protein
MTGFEPMNVVNRQLHSEPKVVGEMAIFRQLSSLDNENLYTLVLSCANRFLSRAQWEGLPSHSADYPYLQLVFTQSFVGITRMKTGGAAWPSLQ